MKDSWDECGVDVQAKIVAFDQIVAHDDVEHDARLMGAGMPRPPKPAKKKGRSR